MLQILGNYVESRTDRRNETVKDAGAKSTQNIKMDISDDYLFIIKYSFKTINMFKGTETLEKKLYHKEKKKFKKIENKMKKLSQVIANDLVNSKFDNIVTLAMTYYNFGLIYKKYFSNPFIAKEYLIQCTELLKGRELDPKAIVLVIEAYIELSYIWKDTPNPEKYYTILIKALEAYSNYTKEEGKYLNPIIIENILGISVQEEKDDPTFFLDLLHSIILTHLEQLYNSNPKDKHEYVIYMHNFLDNYIPDVFVYDNEIEFASVSSELSRYFIIHNRFTEAKNYLTAANYMLQKYTEIIMTIPVEEKDMLFDYQQRYTTMYVKCMELYAIYGISLLNVSKRRLLQSGKDQTLYEVDNSKSKDGSTKFLIFSNIDFNLSETFFNVTDKYLLNFNDAEVMVKHIIKWFKLIETCYGSHDVYVIVAKIPLYISTAYRYLTYFEPDKVKQIYLHKQRIHVLKNASEISNKQVDMSAKRVYKTIKFELAIVHIIIVDLINEDLQIKGNDLTVELSMDICELLQESLNNFKKYKECS